MAGRQRKQFRTADRIPDLHRGIRSLAAAVTSLLLTALGLGVAPPLVGWAADQGAAGLGADSLRYALLAATPGFGWAAAHLFLAARSLPMDPVLALYRSTADSDDARHALQQAPEKGTPK